MSVTADVGKAATPAKPESVTLFGLATPRRPAPDHPWHRTYQNKERLTESLDQQSVVNPGAKTPILPSAAVAWYIQLGELPFGVVPCSTCPGGPILAGLRISLSSRSRVRIGAGLWCPFRARLPSVWSTLQAALQLPGCDIQGQRFLQHGQPKDVRLWRRE